MNLSKIHHIAIIVSDYEAAKDFYVNKLGFAVIRENYRPERKDWKLDLRVNENTELEIFAEENPPKRVNRPEACGLRHLQLSKASVTSYLPYQKGVYFPSTASKEKISVGAERQRRYRAMKRWRADPTEENFWGVVLTYAGVKFKTYSGLPFSYEIKKGRNGEYTKELWLDRREKSKSLAWSSIVLALKNIKGEVISVNVILSCYFFHPTIHAKIYTTYKSIDRFFLFLFKHFFVCHFQNFIWKFLHT